MSKNGSYMYIVMIYTNALTDSLSLLPNNVWRISYDAII